nr:uncharacterized protein LOC109119550 [Solanum lycopersicum]
MDVKNAFRHDDIIIRGIDSSLITSLQQKLKDSFHMKDPLNLQQKIKDSFHMKDPLTYFLGLEVHNVASGVFLNQYKYTKDLISLAGLQDSCSVDTPLELNVKYFREKVQQVSQFMQAPCHLHFVPVHHIIQYLLGTSTRGFFFSTDFPIRLNAFSDSGWAGCHDTRCLVTGGAKCFGKDKACLNETEEVNTAQHKRDLEAYKAWKKANSNARGIISSVNLIHNDSITKFSNVARHVELEDEHLGTVKTALLMPLRQSQVVQNLQVSNARKLEKKWERQRHWRRTL